jgi:hypothetical protein
MLMQELNKHNGNGSIKWQIEGQATLHDEISVIGTINIDRV